MEEMVRVLRVGWTYKEAWPEGTPEGAGARGARRVQTVSPVIPMFEVVKAEVGWPCLLAPCEGKVIWNPNPFAGMSKNIASSEVASPSRGREFRKEEVWVPDSSHWDGRIHSGPSYLKRGR